MDVFTEKQARFVTGEEHAPNIIKRLARDNAFVVYDHKRNIYKIHNIMLDFLRSRFTDEEEKKALYRRLGQWFLAQKEYLQAYSNLFLGGDTETILGLFEDDSLPDFDDIGFSMAEELFSGAPKQLLFRYPFAYLKYIGFLLRAATPKRPQEGLSCLRKPMLTFQAMIRWIPNTGISFSRKSALTECLLVLMTSSRWCSTLPRLQSC